MPQSAAGDERRAINFPGWQEALARAGLAPEVRERHLRSILTLLKVCKERHAPATVALIREHLATVRDPGAREGLKWFYLTAKREEAAAGWEASGGASGGGDGALKSGSANRESGMGNLESRISEDASGSRELKAGSLNLKSQAVAGGTPGPLQTGLAARRSARPTLAAEDRGGADWERDLIAAVRARGFSWRTEQTYREWAVRFAEFVRPRSPYAAEAADVGAFLSELVVTRRWRSRCCRRRRRRGRRIFWV